MLHKHRDNLADQLLKPSPYKMNHTYFSIPNEEKSYDSALPSNTIVYAQ